MFRCNLLRRQWQAIFKRDYKAFGLGSGFYVTAALYATDHRNDSNGLAPLRDDIGTASTFTSKKLDVHEISDFTEVGFDKAIKREALKENHTKYLKLDEFLRTLRNEGAADIFVCTVPKNLKYVDYMCIITCLTHRHMSAVANMVRKMHKVTCNENDTPPKIEGKQSRDWIALDLGNIVLHIFSVEFRKLYDLESLWSIGCKYDKHCQRVENSHSNVFAEDITIRNF